MNIKEVFTCFCLSAVFFIFSSNAKAKACVWNVTFVGTVSGNAIVKTGLFKSMTPGISMSGSSNGSNPFEIALQLGQSPMTQVGKGNFQFATNTGLLGGTQKLDVAYVGTNNSRPYPGYAIQDSRLSATGLNVWIGLTQIYQASSGGMNFKTLNSGQSLQGVINLTGRQALGGGQSTYKGNFSGRLLGCN